MKKVKIVQKEKDYVEFKEERFIIIGTEPDKISNQKTQEKLKIRRKNTFGSKI